MVTYLVRLIIFICSCTELMRTLSFLVIYFIFPLQIVAYALQQFQQSSANLTSIAGNSKLRTLYVTMSLGIDLIATVQGHSTKNFLLKGGRENCILSILLYSDCRL